jgi:nucleotide-binding universal stress UspA family protein
MRALAVPSRFRGEGRAEMKRILVATDGSETARAAVEAGVEVAAEEGAELVFAHVISVLDFAPRSNGVEAPPERIPRAEDDAVLSDALARAAAQGITAKPELLIGYPPKQILRLARDIEAGMIVVGSRGLGSVKSVLLGSTSHEVLAKADRPVMVVRETGARELVGT